MRICKVHCYVNTTHKKARCQLTKGTDPYPLKINMGMESKERGQEFKYYTPDSFYTKIFKGCKDQRVSVRTTQEPTVITHDFSIRVADNKGVKKRVTLGTLQVAIVKPIPRQPKRIESRRNAIDEDGANSTGGNESSSEGREAAPAPATNGRFERATD